MIQGTNVQFEGGGYIGSATTAMLAVVQTNEIFQTIEIILACISFAVSIAYTVYKWYKKAKQDGKVTKEEVGELLEDLKDTIDKEDSKHGN